jgi:hypothetical protein
MTDLGWIPLPMLLDDLVVVLEHYLERYPDQIITVRMSKKQLVLTGTPNPDWAPPMPTDNQTRNPDE